MAKTEKTQPAAEAPAPAPAAVAIEPAMPRIGALVFVQPIPGRKVWNTEVGAFFAEGERTPQTVTVTTHRRLLDGDLLLA